MRRLASPVINLRTHRKLARKYSGYNRQPFKPLAEKYAATI
jgi:hypothetical protein